MRISFTISLDIENDEPESQYSATDAQVENAGPQAIGFRANMPEEA